jgi:hypothetical protein
MRADRRTDIYDEADSRFSRLNSNAPKNDYLVLRKATQNRYVGLFVKL